jgi:hypothetical protein
VKGICGRGKRGQTSNPILQSLWFDIPLLFSYIQTLKKVLIKKMTKSIGTRHPFYPEARPGGMGSFGFIAKGDLE